MFIKSYKKVQQFIVFNLNDIFRYTNDSEAERFRTLFADGRMRILILSERYYFFRR